MPLRAPGMIDDKYRLHTERQLSGGSALFLPMWHTIFLATTGCNQRSFRRRALGELVEIALMALLSKTPLTSTSCPVARQRDLTMCAIICCGWQPGYKVYLPSYTPRALGASAYTPTGRATRGVVRDIVETAAPASRVLSTSSQSIGSKLHRRSHYHSEVERNIVMIHLQVHPGASCRTCVL